jgi:hypothetical protein
MKSGLKLIGSLFSNYYLFVGTPRFFSPDLIHFHPFEMNYLVPLFRKLFFIVSNLRSNLSNLGGPNHPLILIGDEGLYNFLYWFWLFYDLDYLLDDNVVDLFEDEYYSFSFSMYLILFNYFSWFIIIIWYDLNLK